MCRISRNQQQAQGEEVVMFGLGGMNGLGDYSKVGVGSVVNELLLVADRHLFCVASNLAANAFEFFYEGGDFLEDGLLHGQVFGMEGAHFGKHLIECGTAIAGIFPLEGC